MAPMWGREAVCELWPLCGVGRLYVSYGPYVGWGREAVCELWPLCGVGRLYVSYDPYVG